MWGAMLQVSSPTFDVQGGAAEGHCKVRDKLYQFCHEA